MRIFTIFLSIMLAFISTAPPSFAQSNILAGKWRTDWGPAEVLRDGAGFRGTYKAPDGNADDDGTFVLNKNGKSWTGYWAEPSSNEKCDTKRFGTYYWGRLKLASAFSERGFDMNWGYCDDRNPSRLWVFNIKTGSVQTADSRPVYEASSVIKKIESGFWQGSVRSNAQGYASYCVLSAQKRDETFTIQLYWNSDGFHVLIYSDSWSLNTGDEFRGRVRIDKRFDGLIDATIFDSESIDYTFGFNDKARKAFQRGRRIWLEGPLGKKTFQLNGTRKAVDVLQNCAQDYLQAGDVRLADSAPSFEKGLAAYKEKDFDTALENWRPLAEQGDARLQSYVGEMYRDGEGVAQDYKQAFRWFKLAAEQGNIRAQNSLGMRYYNGQGVARDLKKAAYWFKAAAKQGNAPAQNNLGEMFRDGIGVARNTEKATAWFRKAAEQGDGPAQENLDAILANEKPSVQILSDNADDIGKPFTLEILGDSRMETGRTVLHPGDKVDVMFTALSDLSARSWIGFVADDAAQSPEPENLNQETVKNRTDGIMVLGVPWAPGDYRLWMYDKANGIMLAEERVRIVVDMNSTALIDRAFDLLEGDPTPQMQTTARKNVETAVENGDRRALLLLSLMFESGIGGPVDADKARDYLNQAADALLPDALYQRALLTAETDPDSALRDIRLAAAEGFIPALQVYATLSYWESADPETGASPPPPPSVAKGELIAIQAMLASLGYQAGPPLGEITDETTAAIMAFQQDENLPVDGFPTLELRGQLVKAIEGGG